MTKISSNFWFFSSPGPRFGYILRYLEERIQTLVDMASFGPVEVGDFRVAKMFFLKKVWTPRKHREKMFPTFRGARRRHPGGQASQRPVDVVARAATPAPNWRVLAVRC